MTSKKLPRKQVISRHLGWVAVLFAVLALLPGAQAQDTTEDMTYGEAPELAQRVAAGELPPVEERLPPAPMVVPVVERIGQYGGAWRNALVGGGDNAWIIKIALNEHLVRWDPEWTGVIPNVAESFKVSDDASQYTFHLREGIKWSDGQPFTADDIMFWWEDVYLNEELSPNAPLNPLTVEKLDDYTVRFTFERPDGLFLQNTSAPGGWMYTGYPRHYLEQFHIDYNPEGIDELIAAAGVETWVDLFNAKVGWNARWENPELPTLNPWVITAPYDGSTTRVVAQRNPYYWKVDPEGNQLPYLDRINYDIFENAETLLLRALGGEIDMIARHINTLANRAVLFDGMERGGYSFFEAVPANMNTVIIALNLTHKDPVKREIFQNKEFRIGLSHAINRQEIIDIVYISQGQPWQAAPRPESPLYHEQLATQYLEYDVDLANEHLDNAGYAERDAQGYRLGPDGQRISFSVEVISALRPDWADALELIQEYWREVGIDMQIRTMDRSLFYTRKDANEHDANVWAGDGGMVDALLEPRWYVPTSGESNFAPAWARWFNPAVFIGTAAEEPPAATQRQMELYRQLQASPPDAQADLMRQILDIAAEEFYVIGVSLPAPGYGIVRNNFHNVPASMPDAWLYPSPAPTNPEQYFIDQSAR
jgi:peptide/nickel transport system substrate-binding protein